MSPGSITSKRCSMALPARSCDLFGSQVLADPPPPTPKGPRTEGVSGTLSVETFGSGSTTGRGRRARGSRGGRASAGVRRVRAGGAALTSCTSRSLPPIAARHGAGWEQAAEELARHVTNLLHEHGDALERGLRKKVGFRRAGRWQRHQRQLCRGALDIGPWLPPRRGGSAPRPLRAALSTLAKPGVQGRGRWPDSLLRGSRTPGRPALSAHRVAVHLPERVGEQFDPRPVGIAVSRSTSRSRPGSRPRRRRACPSGGPNVPA